MRKNNLTMLGKNATQDKTIFHMLNPNDNDFLEDFSEKELLEFIILLEKYNIEWREELDINKKANFGVEIECCEADINEIKKELYQSRRCQEWTSSEDKSLADISISYEKDSKQYTCKPQEYQTDILNNKKWDNLKEGCSIISPHSRIDTTCGLHIHVGANILGRKKQDWLNFFNLWTAYEDILFKFSSGEYDVPRFVAEDFAKPVAVEWNKNLNRYTANMPFDKIIDKYNKDRYCSINLENVSKFYLTDTEHKNTIEKRVSNGTSNPIIIQNDINTFLHQLEYAKNKRYNISLINYRREELMDEIENKEPGDIIEEYNKFDPYKAFEFCDLVFDNNLDKINFMKQYIKSLRSTITTSEKKNLHTLIKKK